MTKFLFKIIEHYSQIVSVEAEDLDEAYEKINSEWDIPVDFESREVAQLKDEEVYSGAYGLK